MTDNPTALSSQLEDYLEAIYHLQEANSVARSKDIAQRLGVSRASVTAALKSLAERGLINYAPYSYVTLTDLGAEVAAEIIRRHDALCEFFGDFLRLSPEAAEGNACRVEHALDAEAAERLVRFLAFLKECPRTGREWAQAFSDYCRGRPQPEACAQCLDQARDDLRAKAAKPGA